MAKSPPGHWAPRDRWIVATANQNSNYDFLPYLKKQFLALETPTGTQKKLRRVKTNPKTPLPKNTELAWPTPNIAEPIMRATQASWTRWTLTVDSLKELNKTMEVLSKSSVNRECWYKQSLQSNCNEFFEKARAFASLDLQGNPHHFSSPKAHTILALCTNVCRYRPHCALKH